MASNPSEGVTALNVDGSVIVDESGRTEGMTVARAMGGRELKLAIGKGPICPHCGLDTFDDWWHEKTIGNGIGAVQIEGRLKCHGCGKMFRVEKYYDGACHSTAWKKRPSLKATTASKDSTTSSPTPVSADARSREAPTKQQVSYDR